MKRLALAVAAASVAFAAADPTIGTIKLEAPSGVPVAWSRDSGRHTFYVGCGRLDFTNDKKESRATSKAYFYAWRWHYQTGEFDFGIEEIIDGSLPEIVFVDLNGDGIEEVILKNVAGAHTHAWRIYQRDGRQHGLKKIGEIRSDEGKILITDRKSAGHATIEAWDRNYDDPQRPKRWSFSFKEGRYQRE